jgi:hypothetical protein
MRRTSLDGISSYTLAGQRQKFSVKRLKVAHTGSLRALPSADPTSIIQDAQGALGVVG